LANMHRHDRLVNRIFPFMFLQVLLLLLPLLLPAAASAHAPPLRPSATRTVVQNVPGTSHLRRQSMVANAEKAEALIMATIVTS